MQISSCNLHNIDSFDLASSQMLGLELACASNVLMHSDVGVIYGSITNGDATSGAIGGALGSVLAGSAALVTGGDPAAAASIATSAHENNFLQHVPKVVKAVSEIVKKAAPNAGKEVTKAGTKEVAKLEVKEGTKELVKTVSKAKDPVTGGVGKTGPPAVAGSVDKVNKATKLSKDQPWNVRPGQEYKTKIIGRAQKTGTEGHGFRSYREAISEAKKDGTSVVFLNRGMNRVVESKKGDTGYMKPNRRPDVTIVRKDGTIDQIEVPSKSDRIPDLEARMEDTRKMLHEEKQGETFIRYISKPKDTK